jgi:hypothetical protein
LKSLAEPLDSRRRKSLKNQGTLALLGKDHRRRACVPWRQSRSLAQFFACQGPAWLQLSAKTVLFAALIFSGWSWGDEREIKRKSDAGQSHFKTV